MKKTLSIVVALAFVLSFAACGDDSTGDNNSTVNCTDGDGDGYGVGTDCDGADCNDADSLCWNVGDACCNVDCTDADSDGYGVGADCTGADCDDADAACWAGTCCPSIDCADADGDGYGNGADCQGLDCDDSNVSCWNFGDTCCPGDCVDADGDGYGVGTGCSGPDCNDGDVSCNTGTCCPAGNGNAGEACSDPSQCTGITVGTAECLTSLVVLNFPGGYCTGSGCTVGSGCDAAGGVCADLFGYAQYCLKACTNVSECRAGEGYDCAVLPGGAAGDPTYCMPPMGAP
jgi:hypothetical protein